MIREVINHDITKQAILENITSVCELARQIVESLYSDDNEHLICDAADIRKVIEQNQKNKAAGKRASQFTMLAPVRGATGVYLFIDSDCVPVYIGKGGTGSDNDLAVRVRNECKICPSEDTGATLSKNIKGESKTLNKKLSDKKVKSQICALKVIVIKVGDKSDADTQRFATYLESLLLLLFKPRYNKQA